MFRLLTAVLAIAVAASACATGADGRRPQPLPHLGEKPVAFYALGSRYSVPVRINITDHDRQPGMAWFDFTDQNTGCKGSILFSATSDSRKANTYVSVAMEKDVANFKSNGVESDVRPTTQPMLGDKAAVRVANLTTASDKAAKAHFGLFVADQQLAVMGEVFCTDPGLIEPQLHSVAEVVNSQTVAN